MAWTDPVKRRTYDQQRRLQNPEKFSERDRQWRIKNLDKVRAQHKAKRAADPGWDRKKYAINPESRRKASRKWYFANKGRALAKTRRRQIAKTRRTPVWADHEWINHAYEMAADMTVKMGESFHVDHIIPLQGKTVSGLHVYENLQILLAKVNIQKSCKF